MVGLVGTARVFVSRPVAYLLVKREMSTEAFRRMTVRDSLDQALVEE
jgi:hypothetical protein